MKKNTYIAVVLAIAVIIIFIMLGAFGFGGFAQQQPGALTGPQAILDELAASGSVSALRTYDLVPGTGAAFAPGDTIAVHYTGVLPDGTVFDSSVTRGVPLTLIVAADGSLHTPEGGGLIRGWDEGLQGMKEGGKRLLAIPPALGYGANAVGSIPPNSTLIFEIELVRVTKPNTGE